jgi:hypothetical protein
LFKSPEKAAILLGIFKTNPGLTHFRQPDTMLHMITHVANSFYFYFFTNPLRPQPAEEVVSL